MTQSEKQILESKIIELETEITMSILNGHKSRTDDIFKDKRRELELLRCTVFGSESTFCKKIFFGDE